MKLVAHVALTKTQRVALIEIVIAWRSVVAIESDGKLVMLSTIRRALWC